MASSQLVQHVGPQSYYEVEEDEFISRSIRKETESVFYEFVDESSEEDSELTFHQKTVLHNSASTCIRESGEVQGQVIKTRHRSNPYMVEWLLFYHMDSIWLTGLGDRQV